VVARHASVFDEHQYLAARKALDTLENAAGSGTARWLSLPWSRQLLQLRVPAEAMQETE